ncbi:glyoxalase family protein [marine gamma proteobacterium HTCC2148]|jgi:3,4-dihydroxy-9,10-secoandrosta-1,3,5(10)-triene-9,17-dione 4,5-dioxygenase|nr:glyoxalase family protein [marine gamma proteobacterium HTCC2148]MDG1389940.1 VOC family protein [Halioglobus sp.]
MSVSASGYLRIGSTDVDAWMDFGTGVLGMMDAQREDTGGARFLRLDDHPFRFMVEPAEADGLIATGLEFPDEDAFIRTCEALVEAGHTVTEGSADNAKRRCVTAFATVVDPSGNTIELYWGRELDYTPLISPQGVAGFVTSYQQTGDMGFGHLVLPAPDFDATSTFYTEIIGMGITDILYPPGMEGAKIHFMHANNPRQHSLALFNAPHPLGVVHIMIEVETMDELGRGMDRAKAAGAHFMATLGRHVNDNMCSVYLLAPGGIAVEFGYDGILIDPQTHVATVSTEGDLWGHEYSFPGVED